MIRYKIDHGDFQFVEQQSVMSMALDPNGTGIDLTIYANKKVKVLLSNSETGDTLQWEEGEKVTSSQEVIGFDLMSIHTTPSTKYAIRAYVTFAIEGEANDGQPVVLEPDVSEDMRIERAAQQLVIREMAAAGFDASDIEDLLTGLNSNEELDFEDDVSMPSEAEMNDLIDQARLRAAQQAAEASNGEETSDPPPQQVPPADEAPSE